MKKIFLLYCLILSGCHILNPPSTPMPTGELMAIGTDYSPSRAKALALNQANSFCRRWNGAASPIDEVTLYQGKGVEEKYQEGLNRLARVPIVNRLAIDRSAYQTTLKYKCY